MKLPLVWLKKYIDPKISTEELADRLTLTGTKVEGVETVLGESVIEIEVTTNRPDCLSILGLAREVSAITGKSASIPKIYSAKEASRGAINRAPTSVSVKIEDKKACPYYTARLIENVRVASAPAEASKFLELMGTRPISNVVDVTNFVLFESGQPLHAFDADKLEGGQIVVRRARSGESLIGIDGNEYKLDSETLVIADAARPVAIAGVIGGKLTEVSSLTKRVILESAWFDPALVRRAVKKYKISTESSYRFERRTDIRGVAPASRRASELIAQWAGGQEAGRLMEAGSAPKSSGKKVTLRLDRLEAVLGVSITAARALGILKKLGLSARSAAGKKIVIDATTAREDLLIEEDLIEEILRIEGFDKIPATLPVTRHALNSPKPDPKPQGIRALKHHLASSGFREILTYSLLSSKVLEDSGCAPSDAPKIANAVSAEQEYMRPSLFPGMLNAVSFNLRRKAHAVKFFEIGKRYSKTAQNAADCFEETVLTVAACGPFEENWKRKSDSVLSDIQGAVLDALRFMGAGKIEFKPLAANPRLDQVCELLESGRAIGWVGRVSESLRKNWDIPTELYVAEVSVEALLGRSNKPPRTLAPF